MVEEPRAYTQEELANRPMKLTAGRGRPQLIAGVGQTAVFSV